MAGNFTNKVVAIYSLIWLIFAGFLKKKWFSKH